jgi:hypothetical protein
VLLPLFRGWFVAASSGRRPCHPRSGGIDLLSILKRHPRRLPSAGLRDRRQVNVELRKILRGAYPGGVPTHLRNEPRRHADPPRNPFKDRRDAAGMQRIANFISTNQPAKYRPLGDLGMLEPDLEPFYRLAREISDPALPRRIGLRPRLDLRAKSAGRKCREL